MSHSDAEPILAALELVGEGISRSFGELCEVAIHDLRRPQDSLVKLFNGHVTGRKEGAPIRDLVVRVLRDQKFHGGILANYRTETQDGRVLKSTTVLVRDSKNVPIAALCINYDVSALNGLMGALSAFLEMDDLPVPVNEEVEVHGDVWQTLEHLVDRVISTQNLSPSDMQKEHRVQVVSFLDDKGVFLVRGAVDFVAQKLEVSRFSIYNYIEEARVAGKKVPNTTA